MVSVEIHPQDGLWSVSLEEARTWLGELTSMIIGRSLWVIGNGLNWRDGEVLMDDVFRNSGPIPTGLPRVPTMGLNFALRRFEDRVWWKDRVQSQSPKEIQISMHESQEPLDTLTPEITADRINVTKKYCLWHGELVDEGSYWNIFPTIAGSTPKRLRLRHLARHAWRVALRSGFS
jgi:hypothetical protein